MDRRKGRWRHGYMVGVDEQVDGWVGAWDGRYISVEVNELVFL